VVERAAVVAAEMAAQASAAGSDPSAIVGNVGGCDLVALARVAARVGGAAEGGEAAALRVLLGEAAGVV